MFLKNIFARVAFVAILFAVTEGCATDLKSVTLKEQGFSAQGLKNMTKEMHSYVDQNKVPGIVILVAKNGELVYSDTYGYQNIDRKTPIREDSIFRIYSMTKTVVSAAAMTLYEEGAFKLDDPVSKYIPEFKNLEVYVSGEGVDITTEPLDRPLAIADLFTHTSGFTYHFTGNSAVHKLYRKNGIMPGVGKLRAKEGDGMPSTSLKEFIERLSKTPLLHQPGESFSYGVSTDVLGYLVEVWSGVKLDTYLEKTIFSPLDMHDTAFQVSEKNVSRFMSNHTPAPDGIKVSDDSRTSSYLKEPLIHASGAGLVSTAKDYMRFTQMILNGGDLDGVRVLSEDTIALMSRNHIPSTVKSPQEISEEIIGFGLGMAIIGDPKKARTSAMAGLSVPKGTMYWGGAASTSFWIDPENQISVVLMTQLSPRGRTNIVNQMSSLLYDALLE